MISLLSVLWLLIQDPVTPKFEAQVVDNKVTIGYGLAVGDVDGDQKPDILLADKKQFVWYRNGDWKRFVIAENLTSSDNVCIAARDIDGDGKVEVAVGGQWNPAETIDTLKSGSVHYLVRPQDPTTHWKAIKLYHEPTIHRMRWVKIKTNDYQLIVLPLHGKGNRLGDGTPVRVMAYEMPKEPGKKWTYTLVDQSMHMTHNFDVRSSASPDESITIAGKEGIKTLRYIQGKWTSLGYRVNDQSFGEVRMITDNSFAGIIPMHGNELVVYKNLEKTVLTADLNEGHALAVADLFGSNDDEIIVGWREPDKQGKTGIKIFNRDGEDWKSHWIDANGTACEDLVVADLDGNGKKDIIAAGRNSHNLKIYWNR